MTPWHIGSLSPSEVVKLLVFVASAPPAEEAIETTTSVPPGGALPFESKIKTANPRSELISRLVIFVVRPLRVVLPQT